MTSKEEDYENNEKWRNTKTALKYFDHLLSCNKCNEKLDSLYRYTNCGHFFCSSCIGTKSKCPSCDLPANAKEVEPDHVVANLIRCCTAISDMISESTNDNDDGKRSVDEEPKNIDSGGPNKPFKKTPPFLKNFNKRNDKGESRLHIACRKGNVEVLKQLLEVGASPNTKDFAGWTPLQEAVDLGFYEICSLLLEAGALPNTPGMENRTALHEAVANNRLNEAELLLHYNADKKARDSSGKKPLDYCVSEEMHKILTEEHPVEELLDKTMDSVLDHSFLCHGAVLLSLNLSSENQMLLQTMASKHKMKLVHAFKPTVSHVIVEVNEQNFTPVNYDILLTILHGKWLLNSQWIRCGIDMDDLDATELDMFEVYGTTGAADSNAPFRSRENSQKQNPRLLSGCSFFFALKNKTTYNVGNLKFTKATLSKLVTEGEGALLTREPNLGCIQLSEQVPFHVSRDPDHPLYKCSHYIIYMPGKEEPELKYNMPHIKSLPLLWLIESIERFKLLDPTFLGLTL